jgi:hypothetical protein
MSKGFEGHTNNEPAKVGRSCDSQSAEAVETRTIDCSFVTKKSALVKKYN